MSDVEITLAHSADADDVYMWWPITGKLAPRGDGERATRAELIEGPRVVVPGLRFVARPGDIGVFNKLAVSGAGSDEVVALSYPALAACKGRYLATTFGSSFGDRYGPSLVARAGMTLDGLAGLGVRARIAVPGLTTTACIALRLCYPWLFAGGAGCSLVELPFDRIGVAVRAGEVAAGLIIHEEKLTFADDGELVELADLGRAWFDKTGLALPLGANAVRADLDSAHGAGTRQRVVDGLWASLNFAAEHHEESAAYAGVWAAAKHVGPGLTGRYLAMYVNRLTLDPRDERRGGEGERAVRVFLRLAHEAGLLPDDGASVELLVPSGV